MSFSPKANELSRDYISLGTILQKRKAHAAMFATWALSPKILLFRNQTYHSDVATLSWGARAL